MAVAISRCAVGAVVDDFAVAREDGDGAGELLLVDLVLHQRVQALQPLGGEADGLRLDHGQVERVASRLLRAERGAMHRRASSAACESTNATDATICCRESIGSFMRLSSLIQASPDDVECGSD